MDQKQERVQKCK